MSTIKRILRYVDDNIERVIIITSYFMMAAIIFEEVIKRFLFKTQAPWSVQIPIYLFLILAWIGASYNAKVRSHLRFEALRTSMGPRMRYHCEVIDYLAWVVLAVVAFLFVTELIPLAVTAIGASVALGFLDMQ